MTTPTRNPTRTGRLGARRGCDTQGGRRSGKWTKRATKTKSRASSTAGEAGWKHDRSCRRPAHRMRPRSGTSKGPGNRFLFLAPQGDTPVRITHFRVGDSQCQFGGARQARLPAARPRPEPPPERMLERTQVKIAEPRDVERDAFNRIDTNRDGVITREEWQQSRGLQLPLQLGVESERTAESLKSRYKTAAAASHQGKAPRLLSRSRSKVDGAASMAEANRHAAQRRPAGPAPQAGGTLEERAARADPRRRGA